MATPIEMLCLRTRWLSLGRLVPRYCIVMDGRKVARLREGTSRVQRVPAGPHRIEVRASGSRSRELWVQLADEDPVRFIVERRRSAWSLRHRRDPALDLRVA